MSETKTYVFGEGGNNSQNSFDPNLLLGMMFGGGGFGGFGGGAYFLWSLFLLFAWMVSAVRYIPFFFRYARLL